MTAYFGNEERELTGLIVFTGTDPMLNEPFGRHIRSVFGDKLFRAYTQSIEDGKFDVGMKILTKPLVLMVKNNIHKARSLTYLRANLHAVFDNIDMATRPYTGITFAVPWQFGAANKSLVRTTAHVLRNENDFVFFPKTETIALMFAITEMRKKNV